MREIKFRAWSPENQEMYFADQDYCFMVYNNSIGYNPHYRTDDLEHYSTDPCDGEKKVIVMQYTGLKDKNGKEIYEGDIVQLYRHDDYKKYTYKHEKAEVWADGKYQPDIKEVKFMYGSFVIWSDLIRDYRCFANLARPGESLEVIGNRFEHPELLSPTPSQEAKD